MTVIREPVLGLEQIQRAMLLQLIANVNRAIGQVEAWMAAEDEALAATQGLPYVPTLIERIAPQNFVEGHRPSLISAPIGNYPNVAVWAVRGSPTPESETFDQLSSHSVLVYVEIMVKSETSEEEVNRRIQRTAEAVNIAVSLDHTLGGVVYGFDGDALLELADVFTRKEQTAYGPEWFWQGARLEYAVRKEAVYPSSSAGSFFRTAQFTIDQA
jgi:hypothetical protein